MVQTEITHTTWHSLYKLCGVAAIVFLVYSLVTMVQMVALGGMPATAEEGFALLRDNRLVGLLRLDILTLFTLPLYYLLFLGLYTALKRTNEAYVTLAVLLGCVGLTLVLATPSALSFVALSDRFAAATTEAARAHFLAAGEAVLASDLWHGSGARIGGLLLQIAWVLLSAVMLGDRNFGRFTIYTGLVAHGVDLARILLGFFFSTLDVPLMAIAGPLYLVWFPLLARDLFRLAKAPAK